MMHTITVDDESLAVSAMLRVLKKKDPEGTHFGTVKVGEFLDYVSAHPDLDIAFIDVEMKKDGITLTKKLKQMNKELNIVIYSGHSQYKADALDLHVSSFITKPVTEEKLQIALDNLRFPLKNAAAAPEPVDPPKKLKVTTFGSFVVYDENGKVMKFSTQQAQAVLAYLIDQRGYPVAPKDVAAEVFEIEDYNSNAIKRVSRYINTLKNDLVNAGYADAVIKESRIVKVNVQRISCDLYEALQGDKDAISTFHGYYMIDYAWSERSEALHELKEMLARDRS